jgi:hypothetical protein
LFVLVEFIFQDFDFFFQAVSFSNFLLDLVLERLRLGFALFVALGSLVLNTLNEDFLFIYQVGDLVFDFSDLLIEVTLFRFCESSTFFGEFWDDGF